MGFPIRLLNTQPCHIPTVIRHVSTQSHNDTLGRLWKWRVMPYRVIGPGGKRDCSRGRLPMVPVPGHHRSSKGQFCKKQNGPLHGIDSFRLYLTIIIVCEQTVQLLPPLRP